MYKVPEDLETELAIADKSKDMLCANIPKRMKEIASLGNMNNTIRRTFLDFVENAKVGTPETKISVIFMEGKCYLCGEQIYDENYRKIDPNVDIESDHIVPHSLGGATVFGNMAIVHRDCNQKKKDMSFQEYFEKYFNEDKDEMINFVKTFQERCNYIAYDDEELTYLQELSQELIEEITESFENKKKELLKRREERLSKAI